MCTTTTSRIIVGVNRVDYTYAKNAVAVTAVSRETFVGAKPVATAFVRVTPEQLQSAHAIEQTPLAPTRASYVAATARPALAKPAVAFNERPVVARLNPPAPVVSHSSAHIASAEAAPRGDNAAPAPARKPVPIYTNDSLAQSPKYPNTDARANINTSASANDRQNANGNAPAASGAAQQHPAVKFTPPTKAKDDDYDVHPPLNHKAGTPPPAEHHEAPAPASHPAPAPHESAPPAPRPKS